MIFNRDSKDITYTSDGDFMLTPNKGVKLSTMSNLELLGETIYRRLSSNINDWNSEYAVVSNLKNMIGETLNAENISLLTDMIRRTLTSFRLLDDSEIVISPAISIGTNVSLAVSIRVSNSEKLFLSIIYDTRDLDFQVKFLDEKAV
mgnify:CR=1 FL=1